VQRKEKKERGIEAQWQVSWILSWRLTHPHCAFIMYAVQAHTITHITMPQSQCGQSNSSGDPEAYCYFRLP